MPPWLARRLADRLCGGFTSSQSAVCSTGCLPRPSRLITGCSNRPIVHSAFMPPQYADDLRLTKPALLHVRLIR